MIDTIYTVKGICELFGFKDPRTGRKLMRQMAHTENPLTVTERAVKAWLAKNTLPPCDEIRRLMKGGAKR